MATPKKSLAQLARERANRAAENAARAAEEADRAEATPARGMHSGDIALNARARANDALEHASQLSRAADAEEEAERKRQPARPSSEAVAAPAPPSSFNEEHGIQAGFAKGFAEANARISAVLASEEFAGREKLATTLLGNPKLSAATVIELLRTAPRGGSTASLASAAAEGRDAMRRVLAEEFVRNRSDTPAGVEPEQPSAELAPYVEAIRRRQSRGGGRSAQSAAEVWDKAIAATNPVAAAHAARR